MPLSKIKEEYKSAFISFNGGGKIKLGERQDIDQLAILALESRNPNLTKLFSYLPTLEELKKSSLESALKKSAVVVKSKDVSKKEDLK